uniref:Stathmin n=1 Tax=Bursaphelenchus xylophilus TaxID=6326 RepID=A0A1I7SG80_BURXY
ITFEFTHNETKKVVQRFAYEDAQVYRLAYQILEDRKISTSGFDVHIFIADTEEKLKKIPTFSTVSFGQTYKVFLTPAYYPTSIPDNDKKFVEALRKLFPEIEARQFGQTIRPSVPSRTTNTADEGLKQSSKELSEDSRKEKERTEALLTAPAKPIRHSMDKRLEVEKSSTAEISPAAVDSKTPTSCSEVTEKRRKELPNTVDQKLAEFMEKLTVKMSDDNSRQVEAVKSMIGQIFRPEETEEYKKLKRGCKKLLKELQTSQEVMKKHVDKYNEVKTKLEQERKLVAELQQDLKLSKSQCELNLRKMQGYKKRMDEEIERNVEGEDARERQDEERHKEEGSEQNFEGKKEENGEETQEENEEEEASEEVSYENTAKEDFEVVEPTSC